MEKKIIIEKFSDGEWEFGVQVGNLFIDCTHLYKSRNMALGWAYRRIRNTLHLNPGDFKVIGD